MYTLSISIFLSSLILAAAILASTWYEHKNIKKEEEISKITASGNLVRYNKKTLKMTLCGLSNQRYRCLEFDK